MSDERTLATEVRELFQALARKPNRAMRDAIAQTANTTVGSVEFHQTLAGIKAKCDQLVLDIRASPLKQGSQELYVGAVAALSNYLTLESLNNIVNDSLRGEVKAFEYLTLVDDVLRPLDYRELPEGFLQSLVEKATSMLKDLNESHIDSRLKAHLEKQIRNFLWSIQTFDLIGIEGLTKAWGAMAGEIARSQGMQGARSPEAKKWYSGALPILGAIGLAVTSVSATVEHVDNALTHGGNIVKLLTGGESVEEAGGAQADAEEKDGHTKAANEK
ncbi:hypothetical protein E5554_15975 [Sphingobium sp. PAMC28499]|uniref:hypothetical protein n=1 Tax=Sphingobium sp. PAMC28499 TaxID=2565554 RepID=UPI00109DFE47|nr:hypothetical protein [Sphingobium sp. PAMC28499]QCB39191.1 hypothetical protein E5554_15975 [Sphingobium sp. PAMC28499]